MSSAQYEPGQLLPGTVYRVVRHLATGGMGSVYDVEDVTVEKRYVLKTLHPNLISREDLALRMRDEARSLAKLSHPNIVDVVTAGVTTDAQKAPFYVMERLIGQNLRVILDKTGGLHPLHAYRIAIDVADALEHAHENNIVHRDVKPENIFLHRNANGTTTTKLLDFGIVRLLDRKANPTQGKFIGTLRYASPEQITAKEVGPATDIYSLGLVLFEMLSGRGPFDEAGDAHAIGAAHANDAPPLLGRFVRIAADVETLVASTLAKDPAARPRDCFTLASELRRFLRTEEASPRSSTAANVLTSAPPPTPPGQGLESGDATKTGMIPPSEVASVEPQALSLEPPTRDERIVAVNPVAPTLAAEGVTQSVRPSSPDRQEPPPAAGRVIDRQAPTRASVPAGVHRPVPPNGTVMEDGLAGEDSVRRAMGERSGLVVPSPSGVAPPDDLAFPSMVGPSATGPTSAEASTRPPEQSHYFVLVASALISLALIGGALFLVKAKRHTAVAPAVTAPVAVESATPVAAVTATSTSADAPSAPLAVAPSSTPPVETARGARRPEAPARATASALSGTAGTATAAPGRVAGPTPTPKTTRPPAEGKPKNSTGSAAPAVPFEP